MTTPTPESGRIASSAALRLPPDELSGEGEGRWVVVGVAVLVDGEVVERPLRLPNLVNRHVDPAILQPNGS